MSKYDVYKDKLQCVYKLVGLFPEISRFGAMLLRLRRKHRGNEFSN
jgi:hypothetical protein